MGISEVFTIFLSIYAEFRSDENASIVAYARIGVDARAFAYICIRTRNIHAFMHIYICTCTYTYVYRYARTNALQISQETDKLSLNTDSLSES